MRAVVYDQFGELPRVRDMPDPVPSPYGAVLRVEATGLCRSDWHGWRGHDPGIALPHVPGHEFAGTVVAVGTQVRGWEPGARVTVPFVCACGTCAQCAAGAPQVCVNQRQPGFTDWGSYAELVAVEWADVNLVALAPRLDFSTAASLGCRYATAFRAVVAQGRVRAGQHVAVHGCGGVGLAAVQVAVACGARVVAVDVVEPALALARELGAATVDAAGTPDVPAAVRDLTGGGAHVSLDAAGSPASCVALVRCLRRRGRHVQVGLLPPAAGRPDLPMDLLIAGELEVVGSHGMAAHAYPDLLRLVEAGRLDPQRLVRRHIRLAEAGVALADLDRASPLGFTVIEP